jgi:glycosyltransferase involved in cell wall biosynthesis
MGNKTISIIYKFLPQYRYDFFCELKAELQKNNITLNLVYGKFKKYDKKDVVDIDWGIAVSNKVIMLGKHQFVWIPIPKKIIQVSDLIILMQENKILSNYPILLKSIFGKKKVGLWGHGVNFQANKNSWGNKFKQFYASKVNWWFAYTEKSGQGIAAMGVPKEKITVVHNSINTRLLKEESQKISSVEIAKLKSTFQIGSGPIGLYCGAMYKEKRLDYLLESCIKIRKKVNDFEMLFLGAGPDANITINFCKQNNWAHYIGPKFGVEKIPFFKMSDIFLLPGAVGLAIIDCFVLNVPMITTKYPFHGPEIDYLVSGYNGILTEDNSDDFSNGAINILNNKELCLKLKKGCEESGLNYSNEKMVKGFVEGVIKSFL